MGSLQEHALDPALIIPLIAGKNSKIS